MHVGGSVGEGDENRELYSMSAQSSLRALHLQVRKAARMRLVEQKNWPELNS